MGRIARILLCSVLILSVIFPFIPLRIEATGSTPLIVGFYGDQEASTVKNLIDYTKLTDIIYDAVCVNGAADPTLIEARGKAMSQVSDMVTAAKTSNPNIKCLISLYSGSNTNMASVCANSGLRATLVSNLVTFVSTYSLDGVDVDWELGNVPANEDLLIAELKAALPVGKLLSACLDYNDYFSTTASADLDWINLMAYDLGSYPDRSTYSKVNTLLSQRIAAGYSASKIVLGIPSYGVDSNGNVGTWQNIVTEINPADSANQTTVATIGGETVDGGVLWWSGVDLNKSKVDLARADSLAGVMLFTLGYDSYTTKNMLAIISAEYNNTDPIDITLDIPIATDDDDGGSYTSTATGLGTFVNTLGYFGRAGSTDYYALALRYLVTIPDGATITTAYITHYARESLSGTTCNYRIAAVDSGSPATWSGDLSALTQTTAKVDGVAVAETANSGYNSASLVPIFQELMGSYSYASGAYMNFLEYNNGPDKPAYRREWDLTSENGYESILHVEYTLSAPIVAPTVITVAASSIGSTTATLNGDLTNLGTASSVVVSFEYGKTGIYGSAAVAIESPMSGIGTFHANLTGLDPSATYYFRAKAVGDDTSYGGQDSFPTLGTTTTTTPTTTPTTTTSISTSIAQDLPIVFGVILIIAMIITAVTTRSIQSVIIATIIGLLGIFGIVLLENLILSIFGIP